MKKLILKICKAIIARLEPEPPCDMLYGFRLDTWHYIGYSEISWIVRGQKHPWKKRDLFFFENKKTGQRDYAVSIGSKKEIMDHSFVSVRVPKWMIKETEIYNVIVTLPSKYLQSYMMEKFQHVWNEDTGWWKPAGEGEKYDDAKKKQENKQEKKIEVEDKVVKIDFGKKDK